MPKRTIKKPLTRSQQNQLTRINKRMKKAGHGPPFTKEDMARRVRSRKRVAKKKR